ncbi:MAG: Flp pilus assembly protein CpaB [Acidimicrobiia bacterium]|nr:Flp pilus assembly protein CpaB [Acidimicrobiia bacterium]
MGKRSLVLIIALALAAVATFAVWQFLSTVEDEARAEVQEVVVYRATQLIETGTPVSEARDFIEESTELAPYVAFEGSQIVCTGPAEGSDAPLDICGRNPRLESVLDPINVAAGPISAGQLITSDLFIPPALLTDVKLSESIPQGKVAIAIRPSDTDSVGGFVRPGDRVNVLASASVDLSQSVALLQDPELRKLLLPSLLEEEVPTITIPPSPDSGEEEEDVDTVARLAETLPGTVDFTQTVLQDVEVLAVGADTRPSPLGTGLEPAGTQIVVFEVTPEQAEKITFAEQYTSVSLSLIPSGEDTVYSQFDSRGIIVDDLFSLIDRIREQFEEAGVLLGN